MLHCHGGITPWNSTSWGFKGWIYVGSVVSLAELNLACFCCCGGLVLLPTAEGLLLSNVGTVAAFCLSVAGVESAVGGVLRGDGARLLVAGAEWISAAAEVEAAAVADSMHECTEICFVCGVNVGVCRLWCMRFANVVVRCLTCLSACMRCPVAPQGKELLIIW